MTYVALTAVAANVVLVLAFLWFTLREREANATVLADFARQAHDREQALIQRIVAPREAAWEHTQQTVPVHAPPAVTPDDDGDFWESREALADRLAAEEQRVSGD